MTTLNKAVLEITADPDNDGSEETGTFEMVGNATVGEEVQVDYQLGGAGDTVNSIVQEYLFDKQHRRRGVFLDLGAGSHIFEIDFNGWEGAVDQDGNPLKWGDGSGSLPADATGEDPLTQMQIFNQYLRTGTTDSLNPATLKIGQYHPDGALDDKLDVAVQGPKHVHAAEDYSTFDGTVTCVEVERLDIAIDVLERLGI